MRRYIDMMMIRFMAHETTRFVALRAHCVLGSTVASMGQGNESLRDCFSKALASMILLSTRTPKNSLDNLNFIRPTILTTILRSQDTVDSTEYNQRSTLRPVCCASRTYLS